MSYHQLTQEQRYQIYALTKTGHSGAEIAEVIGVHKSTVSRELRRNRGGRGYRPQSNGIAERFVRTLKEWLADKAWQAHQELLEFLHLFLSEYNDRPHQGLPIPGLSPNEYAKRIWLV